MQWNGVGSMIFAEYFAGKDIYLNFFYQNTSFLQQYIWIMS